jgi:hypothetical protein
MSSSRLKLVGSLQDRPAVCCSVQAFELSDARSSVKPIRVSQLSVRWKKPLELSRKLNSELD